MEMVAEPDATATPTARTVAMPASLTLGTGQLSGRTGPAVARRVLDAALASGIRRIDTARAYGDGETERVVGAALRSRLDVEVVTKVGLGPLERRRIAALRWRVASPLMGLLPARAAPPAAWGDEEADPAIEVRLDERSVRASVDLSRSALRRDRLDVVLLHELDLRSDAARIADLMDSLRQEGAIGGWGVGTRRPALRRLLDADARVGELVQTTGGPLLPPIAAPAGAALSVHSVLGPGASLLNAFLDWLPTSGFAEAWQRSVGPLDARRTAGTAVLRAAVSGSGADAILLSSRDAAGLESTVAAVRNGESPERLALLDPVFAAFRARGDR